MGMQSCLSTKPGQVQAFEASGLWGGLRLVGLEGSKLKVAGALPQVAGHEVNETGALNANA